MKDKERCEKWTAYKFKAASKLEYRRKQSCRESYKAEALKCQQQKLMHEKKLEVANIISETGNRLHTDRYVELL